MRRLETPTGKLPLMEMDSGWHVLEVRGERDVPGYDPDIIGAGMPTQLFRREVLGSWSATTGKLVYPEFGESIHLAERDIPHNPREPLLFGWDLPAGTGGTPACVWGQLNSFGQLLVLGDLVPMEEDTYGTYAFGKVVAETLEEEYCRPLNIPLRDLLTLHWGDPAGQQKPVVGSGHANAGMETRSAFEVLNLGTQMPKGFDRYGKAVFEERPGWGWVVQPSEPSLTRRLEAVRRRLTTLLEGGLPAIIVGPRARMTAEGFQGGYNYRQRVDGRYELDPDKNRASHVMDGLSYLCCRLDTAKMKTKEEDRWRSREKPVVRAAGRMKERW